jgi:hypothetical protein
VAFDVSYLYQQTRGAGPAARPLVVESGGRAGLGAPFDYAEDVENDVEGGGAGGALGDVGEEEGEDEDEDGEEEDADQLSDMRAMMAQYTHARGGGAPDGLMAQGIAGAGAVRGPVHGARGGGAPAKAALGGWDA